MSNKKKFQLSVRFIFWVRPELYYTYLVDYILKKKNIMFRLWTDLKVRFVSWVCLELYAKNAHVLYFLSNDIISFIQWINRGLLFCEMNSIEDWIIVFFFGKEDYCCLLLHFLSFFVQLVSFISQFLNVRNIRISFPPRPT